jgi:hypothetical protein
MRGEWNSSTNYIGSVETTNYRRDAVIYGTNPTKYYAAISGSGPSTLNGSGVTVGARTPNSAPGDNAWWQYLGEQDFFVAAKIAIFDESFVKNTINIGNNISSPFANIVLAGGRDDPYMAIGQNGTVGANNTQTGDNIIGYDRVGIFAGMYRNESTYEPRFSLKGSGGNFLRWNGSGLELSGAITVTPGGNAATETYASASAAAAYAQALSIVNSLANGSYNVPGNTFITNNIVSSPVLAGNFGYISGLFTVGQSPNSIVLDATTSTRKIYIGTGSYNDPNTGVYLDSTGKFSLKQALTFNGTDLIVSGTINATGGTFSGFIEADGFYIGKNVFSTYSGIFINGTNSRWTSDGSIVLSGGTIAGDSTSGLSILYNSFVSYKGHLIVTPPTNWDSNVWTGYVAIGALSTTFGVLPNNTMYLGRGVNGSNNGIYMNSTNYWYAGNDTTNPSMKADIVGGSISGISSLSVSGAITATGDITANTSDKRLKENIKQIKNALDRVSKINGITYNFTDDAIILNPALNKDEQVGFLAQEVQSVLPHIVKPAPFDVDLETKQSISGENYLTIQYEKIVPLLLEAIKELKAEVEELKKK